MVSKEVVATIGAVLTGGGSAAAAIYYVKLERKRGEEECKKRFDALREGLRLGRETARQDSGDRG